MVPRLPEANSSVAEKLSSPVMGLTSVLPMAQMLAPGPPSMRKRSAVWAQSRAQQPARLSKERRQEVSGRRRPPEWPVFSRRAVTRPTAPDRIRRSTSAAPGLKRPM